MTYLDGFQIYEVGAEQEKCKRKNAILDVLNDWVSFLFFE